MIADGVGRSRKRAVSPAEFLNWPDDITLDEDGVGVDSVDRLSLVQRMNEFFHLHEVGTEDYLVLERRLDAWVGVIADTLAQRFERVTFRTSGSTGAPAPVTVELARLQAELDALAAELGAPFERIERVVAWTPPQHIFGFIFSVLLPARRGAAVVDGRAKAPSFFGRAASGDLHVATPFLWRELLDAAPAGGAGAFGVSSGAACPSDVWRAAGRSRLDLFFEVYGATETAGVGLRRSEDAPFALMPTWRRAPSDADGDQLAFADQPDRRVSAPDILAFETDATFRVLQRRDRVVQVAGVNVSLEHTRAVLLAHPKVRDAAVRQDASDADGRLKAFVVWTEPLASTDDAAAALLALMRERLDAPARAAHITFGDALPRTPGGKPADWRA